MYAKKPATRIVAISSASEIKLSGIKTAFDSPPHRGRHFASDKAQYFFLVRNAPATSPPAPEDSRAATQGDPADTQNKVPAIMDYDFFQMQVYQRTGGQRDSMLPVTHSMQRRIQPASSW